MEKLFRKVSEKKRWGVIKNGKDITFREAIDYRYRNEGQKAIDKDKRKEQKKIIEQKKSQKMNRVHQQFLWHRSRGSKKPLSTKPKPIIEQIDESDPE